MALKVKITKEEHAALSDALKTEYVADGDGFKLDVDDTEIAAEMRRARDRSKVEADEARAAAAEEKRKREELETAGARKAGDIDSIEKSWKQKLADAETKGQNETKALRSQLEKLLVQDVARAIATEISTSPSLILPHIKARLSADFSGDEPITRVLDEAGKPTALSVTELKQSFIDNKDFAAIIIGSKSSGSGATGSNGSGGPKKPSEYTETERNDLFKKDPAKFRELFPQR